MRMKNFNMNLLELFSHLLFNIFKVMVIIFCQKIVLSSQCPTLPGKILCNCDPTKFECSGIQTNITDVQDILANISSISNVIIRVIGLEFEPGFRFENISITKLTLGYGLETLSPDLLFELGPSLISLNLQNNSIEYIDDQLFSTLSNLRELFLDFNELSELESSMFSNLSNLHYLSMSSNVFYEINSDTFENLLFLHSLILSHNNISVFTNVNIKSLSITTLYLDNCSIHGAIENDTFLELPNLEKLDLSYNSLSEIKPHSLSSLKNLQHLNLSYNIIEYVQENAFSELGNLLTLDLRSNKITLIKMTSFANLHNLKYLDMSENKLKALLCEYTVDFAALETVFLQDNEIKEFTSGTFFFSPHLNELNVSGNNLECSCELTDIAYYLKQNSTMKHEDLESINCIIPSTLATMAITNFKSSKCVPEPPCEKITVNFDDEYDYDYSDENTSLSTFSTLSTTAFSTIINSTFVPESTTETTHSVTTLPTTMKHSTASSTETSTEKATSSLMIVISNTTNGSTFFDNSSGIIINTTLLTTSSVTETPTMEEITNTSIMSTSNITTKSALFNDSSYTEYETTTIYSTSVGYTSDSILHDNISTIIEAINISESSSTSNENATNFYTNISSSVIYESTETAFITDDNTNKTNTIIPLISEETSVIITNVTNVAITTKSICSLLELAVDRLTTDSEMIIKNFSYDGYIFCVKWTIQNTLPARSRCVMKYTFIKGTKSEYVQCPTPGEVKLWSKSIKIFKFCIYIYENRVRKSCSKIPLKLTTTSFEYSTATASQTSVKIETPPSSTSPTIGKLTESSTFMHTNTTTELPSIANTVISTDSSTTVNTDSPSTVPISYSSPPPFNLTSFDVYFNTSSFAYVKWNVNKNEDLSVCYLTLITTTQYFDHNEGNFSCERNTLKLQNVKEGDIFKICLAIYHTHNGNSFICKYSLGNANFAVEESKSNDSPNYNSSLIPLVCLLVLLVLIVIFIIFKNLFKKRQESDVYDVRAEEEKSQWVQIRKSTHDRSSMRYSYIAKENPDV